MRSPTAPAGACVGVYLEVENLTPHGDTLGLVLKVHRKSKDRTKWYRGLAKAEPTTDFAGLAIDVDGASSLPELLQHSGCGR